MVFSLINGGANETRYYKGCDGYTTLANWITQRRQQRKQIRERKRTSIIILFFSEEELREADRRFTMKLIAARRGMNQTKTLKTKNRRTDYIVHEHRKIR